MSRRSRPSSLFSSSLVVCIPLVLSSSLSHALAVPEQQQPNRDSHSSGLYIAAPSHHHLLPRIDAAPVGPGLLNDLTLSTGLSLGVVAAVYVGVLAIVGVAIASLSPSRKHALVNGVEEAKAAAAAAKLAKENALAAVALRTPGLKSPTHAPNFSYPTPRVGAFPPLGVQIPPGAAAAAAHGGHHHHTHHLSLSSICLTPTSDPLAERQEVMESRSQAHEQLADLYKLVLEHDEQRTSQSQANSASNSPALAPSAYSSAGATAAAAAAATTPGKRTKSKPANLSLDRSDADKRKSRSSTLLSALLSPKRKSKALSISSPLMTPMSAAMTHHETQEMHPLSPRHYIPMPPPPVPAGTVGAGMEHYAPESPRTIDGRMRLAPRASKSSLARQSLPEEDEEAEEGARRNSDEDHDDDDDEPSYTTDDRYHHDYDGADGDDNYPYQRQPSSTTAAAPNPEDHSASIESRLALPQVRTAGPHGRRPADINISPISVESQHSQAPLVGLPQSPKPQSVRFSGLPQSPKPGATFQTQVPPTPRFASLQHQAQHNSAVRANGALALRAYETGADSAVTNLQFKQTVFERTGMLSPTTPGTAVPYTPYQPFSPCIPMTPSLVTKADRKRMKKLEPKTPTVEMVQSSEDVW
jgi:hypothetical protein